MKVCAEPGCPEPTKATRCTDHTRERDAARGYSTARGYGHSHKKLSTELRRQAIGQRCFMCGHVMAAGDRLALDHTPARDGYRGVVHLSCNAADGARRARISSDA